MRLGLVSLVLAIPLVNGLKCSEHEVLKKYKVDQFSAHSNVETDTPPSKTIERWFVNPCDENMSANDDVLFQGCDSKDLLCGITLVKIPHESEPLLTQVIHFKDNAPLDVNESDDNKLTLQFKGVKWGSSVIAAKVKYTCDTNMKVDEIVSSTWVGNEVQLSVKGPSGCLYDNNNDNDDNSGTDDDKKKNEKDDKQNGSISWFSLLVLYAFLFTFIYLVVVSYSNVRGGSFQDFRQEFVDRTTQFCSALPEFVREVASNIFGSSLPSSSQRGGYSAV